MMILKNNKAFMSVDKANEIAAAFNAADDWTYTAIHCPNGTGYSFVEINDEDGKFVAFVDSAMV